MNGLVDRVRCLIAQTAVGLALCNAGIGCALAQEFDPPPITEHASTEHHVGKVIWVELVTPDLADAERFYGGLLGWKFRELRTGHTHYALAALDGEPVAGLVERARPAGEQRQPAWLTFLAASDVDAVKGTAVGHGGKVIVEPKTYHSRGRQAVFTDPQGAVFAVLASVTGDPPDSLAVPGAWIWSALLAADADTDAAFYQSVFGYEVFDLESADGLQHVVLSTDDYARAGINALPADSARRHPHWLNFVRVVDAKQAAAKAAALGGRVLVAPHLDRHGGSLAVISDPDGAPFGVMEWTDTGSTREPK